MPGFEIWRAGGCVFIDSYIVVLHTLAIRLSVHLLRIVVYRNQTPFQRTEGGGTV